ncbi:MAG: hypothetical protein ACK419_08075, partial [Pyrinomonadaceae bacterium]
AEQLFSLFLSEKRFRYALHLRNQIMNSEKLEAEKFQNPSFEEEINTTNPDHFGWRISEGVEPQIGINREQKRSGEQSLFMIFNSPTGKDFRSIQQMVVVSSAQQYRLKLFFRSNLKAQETLVWQVVDAAEGKVLAETEPIPPEADWTSLEIAFTTLPTTEAVIVRLMRAPCPKQICPISGKVWFDDFSLEK